MTKFRDFGGFLGVIGKLKPVLSEVEGDGMRSAPRSAGYSDRRTRIDDEKERPDDRVSQAGEIQF